MTISLRQMTERDLPFLFDVYASTREEELAQTGWPVEQKQAFLKMQFDAQHRYYQDQYSEASFSVVMSDDVPVGRLYVSIWDREIRIVDIAILSQFRGQGVGTALMEEIFDQAREEGLEVSIHVEKNNPAKEWYEKLGFFCIEDKGIYTLMKTAFVKH